MARYFALVPAAGAGARFGGATPKQYLQANDRPLLWHALACLSAHPSIARVFVILRPEDMLYEQHPWQELGERIEPLRVGADARAQTVLNGLQAIRKHVDDQDWILVHDAVRPCLQPEWIDRLIAEIGDDDVGGLLAVPVSDTLKQADASARVASTRPRTGLWRAQTPQMFRYGLLVRALTRADAVDTTDEASAVEGLGLAPRLVMGSDLNIKVTYPEDLRLTQLILTNIRALGARRLHMTLRSGQGFDTHALVAERKLILGGVHIPHDKGLLGHSDGDALLHAICDALIGAAGLGDIGRHFPDTDPRYKGADSRDLLRSVATMLAAAGWRVVNVDSTIIAEAPKLAPHIPAMVANIAVDLKIAPDCINVKAKSTEKLGFVGRGEGMAAEAVVLISRVVR